MTKAHLIAFAVLALSFLAMDALWLGIISTGFYQQAIGHLLAPKPDFIAAAAFYLIYLAGTFYFAVWPAFRDGKIKTALISGAFFGFVAYATYDLTNAATLKDWPLSMTLIDLIWGTVLTGTCAGISAWTGFKFRSR